MFDAGGGEREREERSGEETMGNGALCNVVRAGAAQEARGVRARPRGARHAPRPDQRDRRRARVRLPVYQHAAPARVLDHSCLVSFSSCLLSCSRPRPRRAPHVFATRRFSRAAAPSPCGGWHAARIDGLENALILIRLLGTLGCTLSLTFSLCTLPTRTYFVIPTSSIELQVSTPEEENVK